MEGIQIIDGDVKVSDDYMALPEFKAFFTGNPKHKPDYFASAIKYLYFVYKFETPLKEFYFKDRQSYVCKNMLNGKYDPSDFEDNSSFAKMAQRYCNMTMSFIKRDYQQTQKDIESLNKHISTIPFVKKVALKNHQVTFDYKGKAVTTFVNLDIEVENSKEKSDALKLKEVLYDLEEKLRTKILKEEMSGERDPLSLIEEGQQ